MANEAVLRDTKIISSKRLTCATSTAIPKGSLLTLSADNTAIIASADGQVFAGVCHADVNNSTDTAFNTETNVTADKGAVFDLVASGAIPRGHLVSLACSSGYANTVKLASTAEIASSLRVIVGMTLEAADDAERVNVEVFV